MKTRCNDPLYGGDAPGSPNDLDQAYWSPSATTGGGLPVDPETVARQVAARLNITAIDIGIPLDDSPDTIGAVGVPVWLWIDRPRRTTTGPLSDSESASGVRVSLTARLEAVEWDMGDGNMVLCSGDNAMGTVYVDSDDMVESPTCGHIYEKQGAPYTITATSLWRIDWTGGGLGGTFPLSVSRSIQRNIGELQAITRH